MAEHINAEQGHSMFTWRKIAWGVAALILVVPAIAMQFTDEVNWSVGDFAIATALLLAVLVPYELIVRKTSDSAYRAASGVALVAAFLLLWVNGAVGIIGSENNDANLMYAGVLAVGILGSLLARFRPKGMARAMYATATAQGIVTLIAIVGDLGASYTEPLQLLAINGFWIALFLGAAVLYGNAAQHEEKQAAEPGS